MAIANFPAALVPIIQTGMLAHEFQQALRSQQNYRTICQQMTFPNRIGQTFTDTRAGLKAPVTTPLVPSTNTNFDNGLTPSGWAVEQFTIQMNMYGDTIDLNTVTEKVGIAGQFSQNAYVNGVQASQTLERLARDALYAPYLGGNTRVRTTGTLQPVVTVDDVRGFQTVWANGVSVPVSAGATLLVTIGSNPYTINAVTVDGSNVSTAPNGISGTLTATANVLVADQTAGQAVQASNSSTVLRPAGRTTTAGLLAADLLTMSTLLDAVAVLRKNAVPTLGGAYNLFLDPVSARQLFADSDFRQLFQGATSTSGVFKAGLVSDFLGIRFMPTTEVYTQTLAGVGTVRRPILVGADALIEANFAGMGADDVDHKNAELEMVDGVCMITRAALDRFNQIIAQSWYWCGGFVAPSDITTNTNIIPTSNNSAFKRAVAIEHIG